MAKYQGREVKLNKPFRTSGQSKKFAVYVRNKKTGNVVKVRYGDPNMTIKKKQSSKKKIISRQTWSYSKKDESKRKASYITACILGNEKLESIKTL